MKGVKMLLAALLLQTLYICESRAHQATRRSLSAPSLPLSKGGWKPVVGNVGVPNTALLNAAPPLPPPKYKLPYDAYPTASRQVVARDSSKLTSIAQSYKPTSVPNAYAQQNPNAPVNSYANPYAVPNGMSHYKMVQSYPMESMVMRQPGRPGKLPVPVVLPSRFKPNQIQAMMQHLGVTSYAIAPTYPQKGFDVFSKEAYGRPNQEKPTDSAGAGQSLVKQQVKTVQQVMASTPRPTAAAVTGQQYKNEPYSPLPPSILGSFGSFGIQSVKGRDHYNQTPTRTTFLPHGPTRHTVFNSYSYSPTIKYVDQYQQTTPKLVKGPNQLYYGNYVTDLKSTQAVPLKPYKTKDSKQQGSNIYFKPSPTDPFHKPFPAIQLAPNSQYYFDKYKVPQDLYSYYTTLPTTSGVSSLQSFSFGNHIHHYGQYPNPSVATIQQQKQQFLMSQAKPLLTKPISYTYKEKPLYQTTATSVPFRGTYEVTEVWPTETISSSPWSNQVQNYNSQNDLSNAITTSSTPFSSTASPVQTTIANTELPEPEFLTEYTATEESNKDFENSLKYYTDADGPTRRPLDEEVKLQAYEPEKHNIDHYNYKLTTSNYDLPTTYRAKTRPKFTESDFKNEGYEDNDVELTTHYETLKDKENHLTVEALPTLPPNKHYKRPQAPAKTFNKDGSEEKQKKRNKIRRRRPISSTVSNSEKNLLIKPLSETRSNEVFDDSSNATARPRIRPFKKALPTVKQQTVVTETTVTTTTTTTTTPAPTTTQYIRKKTPSKFTTASSDVDSTVLTTLSSKESAIMKINRQNNFRTTTVNPEYSNSYPDYSHKQDEKDTPTSDISISTSVLKKEKQRNEDKRFSFHVDAKPIQPISDETLSVEELQTTQKTSDNIRSTTESEASSQSNKIQRPKLKSKYEINRPRFSVKDYRNRLSSTTTTERGLEAPAPKIRFPQRRLPTAFTNLETTTEAPRKKFVPKDPRHKLSLDNVDIETTTEKVSSTTHEYDDTSKKHSSRTRNGGRPTRVKTTPEPSVEASSQSIHIRRPSLRKKVAPSNFDTSGDFSHDNIVTDNQIRETTSERYRSESAIMKIAKDKSHLEEDSAAEQSKRVSDLTLAASKDYNKPGVFKNVSPTSRRVPSYFKIATDDPILPIEAFFPQLNQKKES